MDKRRWNTGLKLALATLFLLAPGWQSNFQPAPNYVTPAMVAAAGGDLFAATNTLAATLANGATIDWTQLGTGIFTTTTQLTALNQSGKVMTLRWPRGITVTVNTSFATPTDSPASCALPIGGNSGAGSSIIVEGANNLAAIIKAGPSAKLWDIVCNGDFTGAQESLRIDGLTIQNDPSATVMGSLLHLQGVFVGTRISNVQTDLCYANCLEVDAGAGPTNFITSDLVFDNDNFQDNSPTGDYPGCVVTINTISNSQQVANIAFFGGAIQFNGLHNPLLCLEGHGSVQLQGITFYNVDNELKAATPGTYWSDVTPIQVTDASNLFWSYLRLFGNINSTYQQNAIEISQSGSGRTYNILIQALTAFNSSGWTCLIKNSTEGSGGTCETGFSTGSGDLTLPAYNTGGGIVPILRTTNYAPPSGANCGNIANGSIWTDATGTTLVTTRFTCVNGAWVGG